MRKAVKNAAFLTMLFTLAACGHTTTSPFLSTGSTGGDGPVCTEVYAYGLDIKVHYPANVDPTRFQVRVQDGAYLEVAGVSTSVVSGETDFLAAGERPGTYAITVSHPELGTRIQSNVTVTKDNCHIIGQTVEIAY
jgi:hypothetical protein